MLKKTNLYKLIPDWFKISIYKLGGKRSFNSGYVTFKFEYIRKIIGNQEIMEKFKNSNSLPEGYGASLDERVIEYPWVLSRIPSGTGNFMDAGSALNIKAILEHPIFKNKKITILNLNPEPNCFWQKRISYVFDDIRNLPFKDNYFDLITCISTLEHIGMDNTSYIKDEKYKEQNTSDFEKAILELKRVLKNEGKILITVPFGKYQNFSSFQQFDSSRISRVLEIFKPREHQIDYYKYEKENWKISDEASCRDVQYLTFPKLNSGTAQAVICLELIK
jgi:SAM-dependent methyltransferase